MEYSRSFSTLITLLLFLTAGCVPNGLSTAATATRPVVIWPTQAIPADARYLSHINIRGTITQQSAAGEYLVLGEKETDTDFDSAKIRVTAQTLVLGKGAGCTFDYASARDIKNGQRVEVTLNSPIQPTHPVSAEASQVVLLDFLPAASLTPLLREQPADIHGTVKNLTLKKGQVSGIMVDGRNESVSDTPGQPASTTPAARTPYDQAYVTLLHCTRIFTQQGTQYTPVDASQLQTGQPVDVLFFGPVATSYPVQARAMEIIIHLAPLPAPTPTVIIKMFMPLIHH